MRSDNVTKGSERAPNRSLFYALGYTPEELERPLIGVVSAHSEIVPGHMNLDKIADAVKAGVQMAGGTPILIPAIGVCDGIAMGHVGMKYSLASRELICDSVETMLMAHQLDGLVLVPNCDKIVPGMVMAAVRMDVPAVVCSGGPMLAGTYGGEEVSLSKMFEAVGAYKAGMITDEQLEDLYLQLLPQLRQLLRYVHCQQHELPVRGHRHRSARQRHHPGCVLQAPAAGKARRYGCDGDGAQGHHRTPDHQRALHPQRADL